MKLFLTLLLSLTLIAPKLSFADSESLGRVGKKTVVVAKAAAYGAVGGLVVGVASQAFKKSTKNIFLFGSLGLYAGIIMGVVAISSYHGGQPYEGPDTYDDYMGKRGTLPTRDQEFQLAKDAETAKVSLYSLSF